MRTSYCTRKQALPRGYRKHRVPRAEHRDYEEALEHARSIYGDARRAGGASVRYWLMYVPLTPEDR